MLSSNSLKISFSISQIHIQIIASVNNPSQIISANKLLIFFNPFNFFRLTFMINSQLFGMFIT